MRKIVVYAFGAVMALAPATCTFAFDDDSNNGQGKFQVVPRTYDPFNTKLAFSGWLSGVGCPTHATINTSGMKGGNTTYTDPACPTGDSNDKTNEGLLLAKTGPTGNYAAGVADIKGLKTMTVTELGYDIRKPMSPADPRGSHCGAGAPRFDISTTDGKNYFLGCNSPAATSFVAGNGWLRLRWGGKTGLMAFNTSTGMLELVTSPVKSISIVFDEGQEAGPDNFGAAILDNIDVNGVLVGQGPGAANGGDKTDN